MRWSFSGIRAVLVVALLSAVMLSGCMRPDAEPEDADDPSVARGRGQLPPEQRTAYIPMEPDLLSKPQYDILGMTTDYVASTLDGIQLFVEIHRPNTEQPVPTILHSSPYNALDRVPGSYPQFTMVEYYVPRGYAVVVADVRGFGESQGCVEVWGPNEQQDQYDLVEWIAAQPWSSGKVGMIGVSYPGTTPMEAAVMAPPHLTTIIAVAGLTDPYFDWHYGGVPNGESYGSPAAYQGIGAVAPMNYAGGVDWVTAASNGGCNTAQLLLDAYKTDGLYTNYYRLRNLSARASNVVVPVLYTEGFTDGNVKPSQLLNWFNALDVPKKGIFGQWAHNTPERADWEVYVHAWFDEHLLGIYTGIMDGPVVEITTNQGSWRTDTNFPSMRTSDRLFYVDASEGVLSADAIATAGEAVYRAQRLPVPLTTVPVVGMPEQVVLEGAELEEELYLSGVTSLVFHASIEGGDNVFFRAELHDVAPDGTAERIVFGALNAALRETKEYYREVPQGELIEYRMEFQPREYIMDAGHHLRLALYTPDMADSTTPEATVPVTVTLQSGPDTPTRLVLPVLEGRPDVAVPY